MRVERLLRKLTFIVFFCLAFASCKNGGEDVPRNDVANEANTDPNAVDNSILISYVGDATFLEDNTKEVTYTVSGGATTISCTNDNQITVTFSNETLFPEGSAELGQSDTTCTISITPASDKYGESIATITVNDGVSAAERGFIVTVTAVNDGPSLSEITNFSGNEDTCIEVSYDDMVAQSDVDDVDPGDLQFTLVSLTAGTLASEGTCATPVNPGDYLTTGNSWWWKGATDIFGNDVAAFNVKAFDGALYSGQSVQVSFDLTNVNDTPLFTTITDFTGTEDTCHEVGYATLAAKANETDADSDTLKFEAVATSSGTFASDSDCSVAVVAGDKLSTGEMWYWKGAANISGDDINAFTLKVFDGTVSSAVAVQVNFDLVAGNDAPTMTTITDFSGTEDACIEVSYADLVTQADEADIDDGDVIQFQLIELSAGTLASNDACTTAVSVGAKLTTGNSWYWKGVANASGDDIEAFTLKAFDGTTTSANPVQVSFDLTPSNDAPTMTYVSDFSGPEDACIPVSYTTLASFANEADVDGDVIQFEHNELSSGGLYSDSDCTVVVNTGTALSAGSTWYWKPATSVYGNDISAFKLRAFDGTAYSASAVQVKFDITIMNDAPTLTTITDFSGNEDTCIEISYTSLKAQADEADEEGDTIQFEFVTLSSGTLATENTCTTAVSSGDRLSSDESWYWKGATNAQSNDINAFTLKAYDGHSSSSPAVQVNFDLTNVNDAPTLTTISDFSGNEDECIAISFADLETNADEADVDGDTLQYELIALTQGTLATDAGCTLDVGVGDRLTTGNTWYWKGPTNTSGTNISAFTIKAYDTALYSDTPVAVRFDLAAQNDAPTLTTITDFSGNEDECIQITYANLETKADEADADGDAIQFEHNTLSSGGLYSDSDCSVVVNTGTTLTTGNSWYWKGGADDNGDNTSAITVRAYDGTAYSAPAIQLRVDLTAVNDAPTLTTITDFSGNEDTCNEVSYADLAAQADDADVDGDTIQFEHNSLSSGGLYSNAGCTVVVNTGTTLTTGNSWWWQGASNASGDNINAFVVRAYDATAYSTSAVQVRFDVSADNDAPTLTSVSDFAGNEDDCIQITYANLDAKSDANDTDGDTLQYQLAALSSGALYSDACTTPVAVGDKLTTGNSWYWKGDLNDNGDDTAAFTLLAFDGTTTSAAAVQVNFDLASVNDAPTMTSVSDFSGNEDACIPISFADFETNADEADVDGDTLQYELVALSSGTLYSDACTTPVAAGGKLTTGNSWWWKGALNVNGNDTAAFTVKAYDTASYSVAAIQVSVDLTAQNDIPTMTAISDFSGNEDQCIEITYANLAAKADEADVDGDAIQFKHNELSSGGLFSNAGCSAVVNINDTLTVGNSWWWQGASNVNGDDINAFKLLAYDGTADSAAAVQVIFDLTTQNDSPLISITPVGPLTTDTETAKEIAFTISDVETAVACGSDVSMTSSDTTLLPNANVVFGGAAPNCTATVTPAAGKLGKTTITLTVDDGTTTTDDTIVLGSLPAITTNVVMWLAADDMDADGVIEPADENVYTDTESVGSGWTDFLGVNDVSQGTVGYRPTWIEDVGASINNKPGVRDAGTDDHLITSAAVNLGSAFTICFVMRPTNLAAAVSPLGSDADNKLMFTVGADGSMTFNYDADGAGWGGTDVSAAAASILVNTAYSICGIADGANIELYIDGTGTGAPQANTDTFNHKIAIGVRGAPTTSPFVGDIPEVIIFDTNLNATNRGYIESYFNTKYGLGF